MTFPPLDLLRLAGLGRLTDATVAERLGIPESTIQRARRSAGIARAPVPGLAARCDEVRALLLLRGPMTRTELAEAVGLTPRRVSDVLRELDVDGLVRRVRWGGAVVWWGAA